jgi:hypothetical protein
MPIARRDLRAAGLTLLPVHDDRVGPLRWRCRQPSDPYGAGPALPSQKYYVGPSSGTPGRGKPALPRALFGTPRLSVPAHTGMSEPVTVRLGTSSLPSPLTPPAAGRMLTDSEPDVIAVRLPQNFGKSRMPNASPLSGLCHCAHHGAAQPSIFKIIARRSPS